MKHLILAFVLILSNNAMASNWMPRSKILAESTQAFQLEETCKNVSGEDCFDIGNNPSKVYSEVEIFLKVSELECLDESDCDDKFLTLDCSLGWEKIKNYDLLQVYCVQPKMIVEVDAVKLAAYQVELAALASAQALQSAKASAKALRECGEGVIDLILVRNQPKNLTTPQVKQMVTLYAPIKGLLETASLNSAKEEVQAITPDGVLITEGDKTAVIGAIDACIGG